MPICAYQFNETSLLDGRSKLRQLSMFDPVLDRLLLQIFPKDCIVKSIYFDTNLSYFESTFMVFYLAKVCPFSLSQSTTYARFIFLFSIVKSLFSNRLKKNNRRCRDLNHQPHDLIHDELDHRTTVSCENSKFVWRHLWTAPYQNVIYQNDPSLGSIPKANLFKPLVLTFREASWGMEIIIQSHPNYQRLQIFKIHCKNS